VGNDPEKNGLTAIKTAFRFLESGIADGMLTGVVEDPPEEINECAYAMFVLLERAGGKNEQGKPILTLDPDGVIVKNGKPLDDIQNLFPG
jgi:hypothetical protein